ncbi:MAG: hypothetical protein A2V90_06155 [Gammaproteobacteria bacterium RBG_16_57_12]|nr:MAG: hypothetical protein A2V90_06155 [Gammaproteobacteria bacterium RBG_16_57_12]
MSKIMVTAVLSGGVLFCSGSVVLAENTVPALQQENEDVLRNMKAIEMEIVAIAARLKTLEQERAQKAQQIEELQQQLDQPAARSKENLKPAGNPD